MGIDRAASSTPKRQTQQSVWAVSQPGSLAGVAHASGVIDLYAVQSARRASGSTVRVPYKSGIPTSLSLRPASAPATHPLIVVGTHTGDLRLDDTVVATLDGGPISCTAYQTGTIVGCGGANNQVIVIDPEKRTLLRQFSLSGVHTAPISRIVMVHKQRALFASQIVTLIDISCGAMCHRFTGHATPVTAATHFTTDGTEFVITACNDAYLSAWRIDDGSAGTPESADVCLKRRRKSPAVGPAASFVAPSAGVVHVCADDVGTVAGLLRSGDVAVWRKVSFNDQNETSPLPTTFVVRRSALAGDILVTAFAKRGRLTLLYGPSVKPHAHTVSVEDVAPSTDVILPETDSAVLISNSSAQTNKTIDLARATVQAHASAAHASGPKVPITMIGKQKSEAKGFKAVVDVEMASLEEKPRKSENADEKRKDKHQKDESRKPDKGIKTRKNAEIVDDGADSGDEDDDEEPSLQEKLAAFGIHSGETDALPIQDPTLSALEGARFDSRISVLLQAVRSKDPQMMDTFIGRHSNVRVARNTVRLMPADIASGELLDMLVNRLRKQPHRTEVLSIWIREILIEHANAIVSTQRNNALTALLAVINERTQALEALNRIQGRLELVVGQAERVRRNRSLFAESCAPEVEYEEQYRTMWNGDEESSSDAGDDSGSGDSLAEDTEDEGRESRGGENEEDSDEDGEIGHMDVEMVTTDSFSERNSVGNHTQGANTLNNVGNENGNLDASDDNEESDDSVEDNAK